MNRTLNTVITGIVFACVLTSCGTAPYKAGALKTASVNPNFKMPNRMAYTSAGELWAVGVSTGLGGLAGGLASAAAVDAAARDPGEELKAFVRNEITKALTEELNKTGLLQVLPSPQGEGKVEVTLFTWGFVANPFSGKMRAHVSGQVKILNASGKKVWSCLLPDPYGEELKHTPQHDSSELKGNLPMIKKDLSRQIRVMARDAARFMVGKK